MHSLKNTIVAVGLLGLSFVFYQLSSRQDQAHQAVVENAANELDALLDAPSEPNSVPAPEYNISSNLGDRKPSVPELGNGSNSRSNGLPVPSAGSDNKFQLKSPTAAASPQVLPPPTTQPRPEAEFDFSSNQDKQLEFKPSAPRVTNNPFAKQNNSSANSNSNFDVAAQRDRGLIAALDQQQSAGGGQFELSPNKVPAKSASFVRDSEVVAASTTDAEDSRFSFSAAPGADSSKDPYADLSFRDAWPVVEKLVAEEKFRDALKLLTRFYKSSGLNGPQRQRLDGWLDALATKVIFSTEHHLYPVFTTGAGDSLIELGRRWGVPPQLIYQVNQNVVANPSDLVAGTKLKKISGSFDASLDSRNGIMTLYLNDLYAGRFRTRIGTSGSPRPGAFRVVAKSETGHEYRSGSALYPPEDPNNHYGPYWIGLEGQLCIHAIGDSVQAGHPGGIGLNQAEAKDLFAILSAGSTIRIR